MLRYCLSNFSSRGRLAAVELAQAQPTNSSAEWFSSPTGSSAIQRSTRISTTILSSRIDDRKNAHECQACRCVIQVWKQATSSRTESPPIIPSNASGSPLVIDPRVPPVIRLNITEPSRLPLCRVGLKWYSHLKIKPPRCQSFLADAART